RTQQSSVIDERQIQNLPISRRNYLDYALLTPGVSDSDNIADSSDFRVAQSPQSGLSFGGNNGRGNSVSVDGAETLNSTGSVLPSIGQEAVQEFQVLRSSFSAEFGAAGGVVNLVSKSGSNSYHGSLFGLFRHDVFDARNAFDFNPKGQSPFDRQQFGGSFGGPLKRDKTFFFAAAERFNQTETAFVNLLTDPNLFQVTQTDPRTRTQALLFDYLANTATVPAQLKAAAAQLRGALTTSNYPRTVKLFTDASGQFPFDSEQTYFSARFDHNFSDRSNGYLRFNLNDYGFENQAAGALSAVSRGRKLNNYNGMILASHNYQFTPTFLNEFKGQFSYNSFDVIPNDSIGPELNIEGYGFFNRDIFLPSRNIERRYDIVDNLSKIVGSHTIKFGFNVNLLNVVTYNETFGGGRFNFGANIPLASLLGANATAQAANPLNQYLRLTPGVPSNFSADANANGIVDVLETPMTSLQAFNLNLPIVYQQGFGDPLVKSWTNRNSVYAQDTWKVAANFTFNYGLRYTINEEPFLLPTYKKDIQPRAGFSWDIFKNGKTVLRGGAGIYTGTIPHSVPQVTKNLGGFTGNDVIYIVLATATSNTFGLPSSFAVYQTALARTNGFTRPITIDDIRAVPAPTSGFLPIFRPTTINPAPGAPLEVRFRHEPNYRSPTTYQASLGIQQDLGAGLSLETSYLFTRGLYITRNRDINPLRTSGPVNAFTGLPTFLRVIPTQTGITSDFANLAILQNNIYESSANSFYHAGTVALTKRFSNHFSLNAHYTLSKTIDEVTDYNSDFSAQNPLNVRLDRALSAFDQRHRAVISGIFASPVTGDSAAARVFGNWQFAPIFIAGSGRPFNLLLGFDANGDGRSQSDRPGRAGRNTGRGEPFYSFDARLARRFFVKEQRYLEFTIEGFNLFNRTNFAGINNTVGTTCFAAVPTNPACSVQGVTPLPSFNVRGDRTRKTTDPLGFTSAANARQLQFGARFNF
ncbi:MAG TPA: hypothetical protein VEF04_19230, partial [Blastocatellia bacterium]|nr:hypothetical protein [Blastocatellia bacterium]